MAISNCIRCDAKAPAKTDNFRGIAEWVSEVHPLAETVDPLPMVCPDCLTPNERQMSTLPRAARS
jgi:hypothetical protein